MTNKKYKMYYDYKKRTNGGFMDAIFLGGILLTGLIWIIIALIGRWTNEINIR